MACSLPFLLKSIKQGLQWAVFEPNAEPARTMSLIE
jgi:hypothetical protein